MVKFNVTFRNNNGDVFEETGDYGSKLEAIAAVTNRGLTPLVVKKETKVDMGNIILTKTVSKNKVADFMELIADTISSGLPITTGTEEAVELYKTGYLSIVVKEADADIRRGVPLSDTLEKYPTVFNESDVNLVRAGEKTGETAEVLTRLAENKRKSGDFLKAFIGAMIYPLVLIVLGIVVVAVLVLYMVPTVSEMYDQLEGDLPYITGVVVSLSTKLTEHSVMYVMGLATIIGVLVVILKTAKIRYRVDYYLLRVPFVGKLITTYETYKISYVLSSLLKGGVATDKSLDIISRVVNNRFIAKEVEGVKVDVEENGVTLSEAFKRTKHAMPVFVQNVTSGESTGELTDKLLKLSIRLEKNLNSYLNAIQSTISPVLIVILAVFIGVLMYAVLSPIYTIVDYI